MATLTLRLGKPEAALPYAQRAVNIVGSQRGVTSTQYASMANNLATLSFAPDRGIAKSILGRASYTVDPRRTVVIEGAVRQNAAGFYVKGEFSEAFGQHWRLTLAGVGIAGQDDDLGQYHHNSHASLGLRFSF